VVARNARDESGPDEMLSPIYRAGHTRNQARLAGPSPRKNGGARVATVGRYARRAVYKWLHRRPRHDRPLRRGARQLSVMTSSEPLFRTFARFRSLARLARSDPTRSGR
jgi:hypothetical protein